MTPDIPVLSERAKAIEDCPSGQDTCLVSEWGKPFTSNSFGNKVKDWRVQAGLPHCNGHGLHKAGAVLAAENGAAMHQMMAIFDWRTTDTAEPYTRKASRRTLSKGGMGHVKFK
ncbi:hypothetical protein [Methylobacterium sp. J-068]|uniref:hypothetical protein n=1 Tax=Methylobacterium sp. J-068 TaxID=2836649 RepID=UPI001FB8B0D8|nr:hypothetical protein [Methylobacterium sp. J-068]MCJ2035603.1 hypothetical protein [Methylobacterium sp. J-068]